MRNKGSPNPRRRLHILRDVISKPDPINNNYSQFNSNKQYLNIKARVRNVVNEPEAEPKKIGNTGKLSSQGHQSNVITKNNNWTSNTVGLSPINDVSKKQPEKMFKRVSVKN